MLSSDSNHQVIKKINLFPRRKYAGGLLSVPYGCKKLQIIKYENVKSVHSIYTSSEYQSSSYMSRDLVWPNQNLVN